MVDFSMRLRELRQERGWTQGQVAGRLGVTPSVVSAYENGIRQPSYEVLIKISRLYGVSSDYLLGISGRRTPDCQHLVSLDRLSPANIALISQLIRALGE